MDAVAGDGKDRYMARFRHFAFLLAMLAPVALSFGQVDPRRDRKDVRDPNAVERDSRRPGERAADRQQRGARSTNRQAVECSRRPSGAASLQRSVRIAAGAGAEDFRARERSIFDYV